MDKMCEPSEYNSINELYSFLKIKIDNLNDFFENKNSLVYNIAKDYVLYKNKKKISKKDHQNLIIKYYNVFLSEKMKNFILFKQSMYVLLNC